MIVKIRIDDRLLHGQVAYSWRAKLSYDAVIIVDDEVVKDDLRKATIKLCCPDGVKLAIRSVKEAQILLKNEKLKQMKVFVICANPKTVFELIGDLEEKPVVNLGQMQKREDSIFFSKAVYLTEEDEMYLNKINELDYLIEVQEVPETGLSLYRELRLKFKRGGE